MRADEAARRRGVRFKSLRLCKRQRTWRREAPGGEWAKPGCRRLSRPQNGGCCVGEGLARFSSARRKERNRRKKASRSLRREKNPDVDTAGAKWGGGEWSCRAAPCCGVESCETRRIYADAECWMVDGGWWTVGVRIDIVPPFLFSSGLISRSFGRLFAADADADGR